MHLTTARRRLLAALLGLVVAVLAAEGGVRVSGVEWKLLEPLVPWSDADVSAHRPVADAALHYELLPGLDTILDNPEGWGEDERWLQTNALGFRDRPRTVEKPQGAFRVICLGGSNTFGAAVSSDETWPLRLQETLQASTSRPVEVWNLGVEAYVTSQKLRLAERALQEWAPDLFVFQLFNQGPAPFLRLPDVGAREAMLRDAFRASPASYGSYLLRGPTSVLGSRLFTASALVRLYWIRLARASRETDEKGGGVLPPALIERAERRAARAFQQFVDEHSEAVPMAYLALPGNAGPDWLDDIEGLGRIELDKLRAPPLEGLRDIHPDAAVYRWYGRAIAQLLQAGCCGAVPAVEDAP